MPILVILYWVLIFTFIHFQLQFELDKNYSPTPEQKAIINDHDHAVRVITLLDNPGNRARTDTLGGRGMER